jgi:tRNA(fMet)-specific endonuclease VapC
MKLALDTNRYVDFCRGDAAVVKRLQEASLIVLPFITLAELRAGFLCGTRARQNERTLTSFLNSPRVAVFYPDEQTTHHYANLFRQLRQQGTPIPTNDLWTAAIVVQHDLLLCARDQHFDHLPQLLRI